MARRTKQEIEQAVQSLREVLKPGDEVWCVLRSVSRSGMSRVIDPFVPRPVSFTDAEGNRVERIRPHMIGPRVAIVLGDQYDDRREGVKIGGCGMDMGFALVYALAEVLFGDGYALTHRWV